MPVRGWPRGSIGRDIVLWNEALLTVPAAEAEAMVERAVGFIKANGPATSDDELTNGTTFKDRGLYVVV